jgi:hypothetical protein
MSGKVCVQNGRLESNWSANGALHVLSLWLIQLRGSAMQLDSFFIRC